MKPKMRTLPFVILAALTAPFFASCFSTKKIEERVDKSKAAYYEKQERRQMRAYARDDRYDAWVDRMLD